MTIRAEPIGSLLRSPRLLDARTSYEAGSLDAEDLRSLEDEAILDALREQNRCGLAVYTDGEFRRAGWIRAFMDAVDGFSDAVGTPIPWRGGTGREPESANVRIVTRRLEVKHRIADVEARFMLENSPGLFKITLPSAIVMCETGWRAGNSDAAYGTPLEFLEDTARILTEEVKLLAADGVRYIQLDNPVYTHFADEGTKAAMLGRFGVDVDALLDASIAADNRALDAASSAGALTAVHLCRGNSMGRWVAEGGYDVVAERLFNELRCDRLLLEYDSPRAGTFAPLRFLPEDKIAVLGLITTKFGELETRDGLLERISEATAHIPLAQLALSPQCGFASSGRGNPLTETEQWAKLELLSAVANEVWSEA